MSVTVGIQQTFEPETTAALLPNLLRHNALSFIILAHLFSAGGDQIAPSIPWAATSSASGAFGRPVRSSAGFTKLTAN